MRVLTFALPLLMASLLVAPVNMSEEAGAAAARIPDRVHWPAAGVARFAWPEAWAPSAAVSSGGAIAPGAGARAADTAHAGDPFLGRQWGLEKIGASAIARQGLRGEGVLVAVLDTGVSTTHEDLSGRVVAAINLSTSSRAGDVLGHGTHVAGIIAASAGNGLGIAGIAPGSLIMSVKVADDHGVTATSTVARGIIWAADNGARVINVSVEFQGPYAELEKAVNYAWEKGAIIVAAAGNQGSYQPVYPAFYENVIAVAGSTRSDSLAPLSSHGGWVDVVAPGYDIYSALPGDSFGYRGGTSFAAAHTSGLAALLMEAAADRNGDGRVNDEVRAAIEAGCQDFRETAAGRIDVAGALAHLE